MNPTPHRSWPQVLAAAGMVLLAFAAGWLTFQPAGGKTLPYSARENGQEAPEAKKSNPAAIDLAAVIRSADMPPIEKRLRIEDLIGRDPDAAFALLRAMPPLLLQDQEELELKALFAWAEREPLAAYNASIDFTSASSGRILPDELLVRAFQRDPEAGLAMLRSRVERSIHGWNSSDHSWMDADPGKWCRRIAELPVTTATRSYLKEATARWARQDPSAAIQMAKELPKEHAEAMLNGILEAMSPEESAAACSELGITGQPLGTVAYALSDKDPSAAAEWLLSLPPADLEAHAEIVTQRLAKSASKEELRAFTDRLPPAVWNKLALRSDDISRGRLTELAPPWALRGLLSRMGLHPGRLVPGEAPAWFQQLPAERATLVVEEVSALAATTDSRNLAALSKLPVPLAEAGGLGAIRAVLAAVGRGSTSTLDGLRYLPPSLHRHVLQNLESLPGQPEHRLMVRRALER